MKVTNWIYIYFMKNAKMKKNFAKKFHEKKNIFAKTIDVAGAYILVFMNICICERYYGVKGGGQPTPKCSGIYVSVKDTMV